MPTLRAEVGEASFTNLETGVQTNVIPGRVSMGDLIQLSDAELVARMTGTPEEQEVVQCLQVV